VAAVQRLSITHNSRVHLPSSFCVRSWSFACRVATLNASQSSRRRTQRVSCFGSSSSIKFGHGSQCRDQSDQTAVLPRFSHCSILLLDWWTCETIRAVDRSENRPNQNRRSSSLFQTVESAQQSKKETCERVGSSKDNLKSISHKIRVKSDQRSILLV
jgi:hypothetical protein